MNDDVTLDKCIVVNNVHKTYILGKTAVEALRGVSITIKSGEFVGLMGASGCGKSTLLNLISGMHSVSKGRIFIQDSDITKMSSDDLAKLRCYRVGYVFQFYNLFAHLTACENVMFPMIYLGQNEEDARKRAIELLKNVGLEDRADHAPSELSGGEQQRVAIARSLANKPNIILLDEPTGDLDSKTGLEILELLKQVNESGVTLLVATHSDEVAKYCSRILRMKDGKIIEGE